MLCVVWSKRADSGGDDKVESGLIEILPLDVCSIDFVARCYFTG